MVLAHHSERRTMIKIKQGNVRKDGKAAVGSVVRKGQAETQMTISNHTLEF